MNWKGCKTKWSWPYIEVRPQHLRGRTEGNVHDTGISYALHCEARVIDEEYAVAEEEITDKFLGMCENQAA
jgi:hypothetical protein